MRNSTSPLSLHFRTWQSIWPARGGPRGSGSSSPTPDAKLAAGHLPGLLVDLAARTPRRSRRGKKRPIEQHVPPLERGVRGRRSRGRSTSVGEPVVAHQPLRYLPAARRNGRPGGSGGRVWRCSSWCHAVSGEYRSRCAGSKFSSRGGAAPGGPGARPDRRGATRASSPFSSTRRVSISIRPALRPPDSLDRPLEHGRPHVQLDLLGHAQARVEQIGEPVSAPRPGLDVEDGPPGLPETRNSIWPASRWPARVASLNEVGVTSTTRTGPVPGPRHSHDVLVLHPRTPSSPWVFWKLANSDGANALISRVKRSMSSGGESSAREWRPRSGGERAGPRRRSAACSSLAQPGRVARRVSSTAPVSSVRFMGVVRHMYRQEVRPTPTGQRAAVAGRRDGLNRGGTDNPYPRTTRCMPEREAGTGPRCSPTPFAVPGSAAGTSTWPPSRASDSASPSGSAPRALTRTSANAERRALFAGLWPPTLWAIGDSLERRG